MLVISNAIDTESIIYYNGYEKTEEQNSALQITFRSLNVGNNPGHELLDYEVFVEDEDGHEYRVKQYKRESLYKQITATHIYFDLADQRQDTIFGGTHSIEEFLTFIFTGTGWSYTIADDLAGTSALIPNFGDANVISLVETLLKAFGCERKIMPGKVIHFGKIIGEDKDLQYRYKYNIKTISESIDTTNLKTEIRGYNSDRTIDVTYTSPLAEVPLIGVRKAEPIESDDYASVEEMEAFLATQLPDAPETSVEVSVTEIDGEVGDFVWLIHEPLGIEYQTRILSKKSKRNYNESSVTVGNTKPKDITDILVSQKATIDNNEKSTRSRFEQTNKSIELAVERIGESETAIELLEEEIELRVVKKDNVIASINLSSEEDGSGLVRIRADKIQFEGHIFGEGATFSGNIETSESIKVGNSIQLGELGSTENKIFRFNNLSSIMSSGHNIDFSTGDLNIYADRLYVPSWANVSGLVASGTPGLTITQSTNNPKLMVFKQGGSDIGYLNLT